MIGDDNGVEITVLPEVVFRYVDGDQVIGAAEVAAIVIIGLERAVIIAVVVAQSTVVPTAWVFIIPAVVNVPTVVVVEGVPRFWQTVTKTLDVPSHTNGVWKSC